MCILTNITFYVLDIIVSSDHLFCHLRSCKQVSDSGLKFQKLKLKTGILLFLSNRHVCSQTSESLVLNMKKIPEEAVSLPRGFCTNLIPLCCLPDANAQNAEDPQHQHSGSSRILQISASQSSGSHRSSPSSSSVARMRRLSLAASTCRKISSLVSLGCFTLIRSRWGQVLSED